MSDPGYTTGQWGGYINYLCETCEFSTLILSEMTLHLAEKAVRDAHYVAPPAEDVPQPYVGS